MNSSVYEFQVKPNLITENQKKMLILKNVELIQQVYGLKRYDIAINIRGDIYRVFDKLNTQYFDERKYHKFNEWLNHRLYAYIIEIGFDEYMQFCGEEFVIEVGDEMVSYYALLKKEELAEEEEEENAQILKAEQILQKRAEKAKHNAAEKNISSKMIYEEMPEKNENYLTIVQDKDVIIPFDTTTEPSKEKKMKLTEKEVCDLLEEMETWSINMEGYDERKIYLYNSLLNLTYDENYESSLSWEKTQDIYQMAREKLLCYWRFGEEI